MKTHYLLLLFLLLPSVLGAQLQTNIPTSMSTGQPANLLFILRAEQNYSIQHINLYLTTEQTGLLNGCNATYHDDFSITTKNLKIIKVPLLYTKPGTYTLLYTIQNAAGDNTNSTTIIVTGDIKNISTYCSQDTGKRRERYGIQEEDVVKSRLKSTKRKYTIW